MNIIALLFKIGITLVVVSVCVGVMIVGLGCLWNVK